MEYHTHRGMICRHTELDRYMLSLSKRTDYALVALDYLAGRNGIIASAREIGEARNLPVPLLMNIMKDLQQHGIVRSTRGAKGGYELAVNPSRVSLHQIVVALEGPVRLIACAEAIGPNPVITPEMESCRVAGRCAVQAPLQAVHRKLVKFLGEVTLAEIVRTSAKICSAPGNGHPINTPVSVSVSAS